LVFNFFSFIQSNNKIPINTPTAIATPTLSKINFPKITPPPAPKAIANPTLFFEGT